MSERPRDGTSHPLRTLVEAERGRPDAPDGAKAAARDRLAALLGPAAGLGEARIAAPRSAIAKLANAATAKLVGAFLVGGLVGGGVVAMLRHDEPRERSAPVERAPQAASPPASIAAPPSPPTPEPLPPASAAGTARAVPSASGRPQLRAEAPGASSSVGASHDTALSAERALIERARSALARGDGDGALVAAAQHEREFPRGQLAEEREVLAIQALVTSSRVQEAAERGARFRKTYPNSLLLPLVDQVLR